MSEVKIDAENQDQDPSGLAVQLNEIVREYHTGRRVIRALDEVSLEIPYGEYMSIVGASGSGKSTLLNIVSAIDLPDSGSAIVLGNPLGGMSENKLAAWRGQNVGIVFQFFQLMPTLTVLENVVLPMDLAGRKGSKTDRANSLLSLVGIQELANNLPSELSGGEQQRAAIARALANQPKLLIADEPTGNLDSKNGAVVIELLEELWRGGATVVLVTHDREVAERAPRQVEMRDGKIVRDTSDPASGLQSSEKPAYAHTG